MDVVKIGSCRGETANFMDLVHETQKGRCARYVEKCHGPTTIFTNQNKRSALDFLDEAFKGFE